MDKREWAKLKIENGKNGKGIVITVRALPEVEDFVKYLGQGRKDPIDGYARGWEPRHAEQVIEVYDMAHGLSDDRTDYTISYPGRDLILDDNTVNISFLRLVGISGGDGVTFTMNGVMSNQERLNLKTKLGRAVRQFCLDYITPTKMSVVIEQDLK